MNLDLSECLAMLKSEEVGERLVAVKTLQHLGEEEALDPLILALQQISIK